MASYDPNMIHKCRRYSIGAVSDIDRSGRNNKTQWLVWLVFDIKSLFGRRTERMFHLFSLWMQVHAIQMKWKIQIRN